MKTSITLFISGLFVLIAGSIFIMAGQIPDHAQELPIYGTVEDFELISAGKEVFESKTLRGKIWLASAFFTSCPEICPMIQGNISKIYHRHIKEENFRIASITVDPETDTPEVLQQYAQRLGADPSRWHFLRGELPEIKQVIETRFKLPGADVPGLHSDRIVLVDQEMNIRGYYSGTDSSAVEQLNRDLTNLLTNY